MNKEMPLAELVTRVEQPSVYRALEDDYEKTRPFQRNNAERVALTLRDLRLSPHLASSLAYAFRDALQVRTMRSWRTAFFVLLLGGTLPLAYALVQMATSAKVQPLLLEKDQHGYVIVLGPAKALKMDDPKVVIASLRDWIVAARSVVRDRPAMNAHVKKVWQMVSPGTLAQQKIATWFTTDRLFANPRRSIDVDEIHVSPLAESERVWKIEWTELLYEEARGQPTRTRHSANVTIAFAPSELEERIQLNPAGVFITDIAITNH